mmetsp:Transcript_4138/g.6774  ORF Transcript_4138/g.6774 Transcript_4138/m.6774 type:complete len:572 (+) Transcript_4138:56-1771(+)
MSQFTSPVPGAWWAKGGSATAVFQLGRGKTLAIPMSVHESARKKLVQALTTKGVSSGIVLLQGGDDQNQYDTDTELVFRQDSWFNYLFGVKEAGVYGAITLSSGRATLFIPQLPDEYRIWCGDIRPPSDFQVSYAVDEVCYLESLKDWVDTTLKEEGSGSQIHVMRGINSDSGLEAASARFPGDEGYWSAPSGQQRLVCTEVLYDTLSTCRVIKSEEEIEVMRYVANVASNAHSEVMRSVKNHDSSSTSTTGPPKFEFELEAKFQYEIYRRGGCRKCAYTCICACGPNSAVLHYGHAAAPNDRELQDTDMALLDMGAEYHGYVSDITCSFPMSGRFTEDQKAVYLGVLDAQRVVLEHMLPGAAWTQCHRLAETAILKALLRVGVLQLPEGASLEDLQAAHVGAVFMPHGLGHLIGCDTHDVGGYISGSTPERSALPGLSKLRTARTLEAGMVLTNEPGCYFIDFLLDAALKNPQQSVYFNRDVLARFRGTGGVRLEDVVVVRPASEGGAESLSTCPRTIGEVEGVMAGTARWPPAVDEAPYLKRAWTRLAAGGLGMEKMVLATAATVAETC